MLGPILCGPLAGAPLLPRLRGHFAEFLDNASPAGLGVLPPSTCVGLRYGCMAHYSGFSRHTVTALPYSHFGPRHGLCVARRFSLPCRSPACAGHLTTRLASPACVPTVLVPCSTGISTCRPSATPLGLALGPDSPRADQLHPGNLGYPAGGIPTPLSLLIPAFSLRYGPPPLTVRLRPVPNAPLPMRTLAHS